MIAKHTLIENGVQQLVNRDDVKLEHGLYKGHAIALSQAFGYLLPYEVMALQIIALTLPKNSLIVNIGAGTGTSGLALREISQDFRIYTVDISQESPIGGLQNERNAFENTGLKLPNQILGDSKDIGNKWEFGEIDFCLVDGDHSDDGCRGDILSWKPHVKKGGIMGFHDYHRSTWPNVCMVVDEEMKDWEMIMWIKSYAFFRLL